MKRARTKNSHFLDFTLNSIENNFYCYFIIFYKYVLKYAIIVVVIPIFNSYHCISI